MPTTAQEVIPLGLQSHPEGGWYRETWRSDLGENGRALATAILFLLDSGERSHWHKVDAIRHHVFRSFLFADSELRKRFEGHVTR